MVRAAALALLALAAPADAGCRLALALGFDVSKSVSAHDYEIQQGGIIAALRDPAVRDAFLQPSEPVALAIFEWSGRSYQDVVLPWTMITDAAAIDTVLALEQARVRDPKPRPTALGHALLYAETLMAEAPGCAARTLDISGDGRNNDGLSPSDAYERADYSGVTVNGLAIGGIEADILPYYTTELIHGPGAFVVYARHREDFPDAIRRKLLRELTAALLGQMRLPQRLDPSG